MQVGVARAQEQPALADPPVATSSKGVFSGVLTAQEAAADIPGFGRVEGLYLYSLVPAGSAEAQPLLAPTVWAVKPGDLLDLQLINDLDCNEQRPEGTDGAVMSQTNIHTHGLIVSPHDKQDGSYGDFVLVLANSAHVTGTGAGCKTPHPHHGMSAEQGSIEYRIPIPAEHPPGLYWFHPHPHGVSQQQLARGLSGVLTIGDLWDYAALTCDPDDPASPMHCRDKAAAEREAALRAETDQHVIMLKDIQVERHGNGPWHTVKWYDAGFCGTDDYPVLKDGACSPAGDDASRKKWLVTVNGQVLPRLVMNDNRSLVLRLANVSASMTYNLELRAKGKLLPFQVIANDGVHAGQSIEHRMLGEGRILLMPSARVEIYLDRGDICRALGPDCDGGDVAASLNVVKWACPDGNPMSCADPWPIGQIMSIDLKALDSGEKPKPLAVDTSPLATELSVPPVAVEAAGPCSDGSAPLGALPAGAHRTIAFWNGTIGKDEIFTMKTDPTPTKDVADIDVPDKVTRDWLKANGFRSFDHARTDLCVTAGAIETWLVYNAADEYHNFHVHQSKFAVIDSGGSKTNGRFGGSTVLHDNYPIPPKSWIMIRVRFSNKVAGRFVYHCHILEHEDKGMMSIMEVVAQKLK
jgi:FtsP/CotA-like multicopper oxidase with cupredoxin domain